MAVRTSSYAPLISLPADTLTTLILSAVKIIMTHSLSKSSCENYCNGLGTNY